jgi:hypothetical protein
MAVESFVFLLLFILSLVANAAQYFWHRMSAKKPPAPKPDLTAQDLLHDLTKHGQAVLRVEVVDMANILIRSPRA